MFQACCFRQKKFSNLQGFFAWMCHKAIWIRNAMRLEFTHVVESFFRFSIGLYSGYCFVLNFSSSSSLSLSQSVSPVLSCGYIYIYKLNLRRTKLVTRYKNFKWLLFSFYTSSAFKHQALLLFSTAICNCTNHIYIYIWGDFF